MLATARNTELHHNVLWAVGLGCARGVKKRRQRSLGHNHSLQGRCGRRDAVVSCTAAVGGAPRRPNFLDYPGRRTNWCIYKDGVRIAPAKQPCVNWEAVTALGTVFAGLVVVVTALVGISQLRYFRVQRRDIAAVELVRSLQDESFLKAYRNVFAVSPKGHEIDRRYGNVEYDEAAAVLGFRFEMLGMLVCRGTIPFEIAEDLVGD